MNNCGFTEVTRQDYEEAKRCLQHDRIENTRDGLFRGIVFCLLSIGQLYKSQLNTYRTIIQHGLGTPEAMRDNLKLLKLITSTARFPKPTYGYMFDLCMGWEWLEDYLTDNLVHSFPENGNTAAVRDELVKRVRGFGYKVASLFLALAGSEDVAAIDVWCLRYLKDSGYDVSHNYERKGGIDKREYLRYEAYLKKEAKGYGYSLAFFQVVVWVKLSSWKGESKVQMELGI